MIWEKRSGGVCVSHVNFLHVLLGKAEDECFHNNWKDKPSFIIKRNRHVIMLPGSILRQSFPPFFASREGMPLSVQIALLLSVALIHRKEESRLASVHPPLSKEGKQSRHRSRTKTQDSTDLQKLGAEKQQPGDNSKEPLMDPHPNVLRWGSSCLLKSQQPDGKVSLS